MQNLLNSNHYCVDGSLNMACKNKERMTDQVREAYLAPYNNYANRIANLRFVQDIPMDSNAPSFPILKNIEENLAQFASLPVLIAWGAKDFVFTDQFLKRWKKIFPDAEVHWVPDAGHYVVEDTHDRILQWVEHFLKRNPI